MVLIARLKWLAAAALAASCAMAVAGSAPRFEDYPAAARHTGRSAKPVLADAQSREYASMLRAAARGKPNFAGRYVLTSFGCGASCTMSAAIDAKTGAVAWLPFTVCCWEPEIDEPLQFKRNSRLLVVHGSRNEEGSGVHYYQFDGKQFSEIADAPK